MLSHQFSEKNARAFSRIGLSHLNCLSMKYFIPKAFVVLATIVVTLIGCDSPRNNRVLLNEGFSQNHQQDLIFQNFNLRARTLWIEGPYPEVFKTSKLMVFVYDEYNALVDLPEGLDLSFFTLMPSMGHGADDTGYF